jgi:phosphatidylglycerophosphatase A
MGKPLPGPIRSWGPAQSWLDRLAWLVGTGFGSGLSPVAPGTAGSLVALFMYLLLPISGDSPWFFSLIIAGFFLGIWATGWLVTEEDKDPSRAVWDEFIGLWVTCLLLPKTGPWMAAAFLLFRALDIVKPWPARRAEALPGGLGIMADDLLVGIYGAAILNAARILLNTLFFS